MLMTSGNDAANALATASGGQQVTAELMNAEAERIGATNTHAVNPSGLDAPGQVSTAYDLALIGRAAMQLPDFRSYVATKRSAISGPGGKSIQIASHDRLLWNYDGAIGIKNGYTDRARATFVGAATRGGHTLVVTLMRTDPRYWPEAAALLDWGFAAQKAGVQPIGQLVDPYPDETALLSAPEDAIAIPVANHQRLAKPERLEEVLAALGVVLLGFLVIARRRRRA
jgi:D-alanyl-D-alanine carboxypeptidase (penicillin-binding protein 5/6)